MREMKLQDLKSKTPTELLTFAEELEVENASTMRPPWQRTSGRKAWIAYGAKLPNFAPHDK